MDETLQAVATEVIEILQEVLNDSPDNAVTIYF